jgi:hypothetical protein
MTRLSPRTSALLLLLALPAGFNEFLTGATPLPALFTDPIVLPFVLGFYGAGVLAIRELSIRWGKGWPSILLMGIGLGIALEGIAARTLFTVNVAAGPLSFYGHWVGVNWVWAVMNGLSDALYTTAVPILLADRIYPELQGRSLLPTWALGLCLVSHPSFALLAGAAIAVVALFALAAVLPRGFPSRWFQGTERGARSFLIVGAALTVSVSVTTSVLTNFLPAAVDIVVLLVLYFVVLRFVLGGVRELSSATLSIAFATGLLVFWFVVDLVRAASGEPEILLVTAGFVVILWRAWDSARRGRDAAQPPSPLVRSAV